MKPIGMREMNRVFSVTDELELSREALQVALLPEGEGDVRRLPSGKIEVVLPEGDLEGWLPELRRRLVELTGGTDGTPGAPTG